MKRDSRRGGYRLSVAALCCFGWGAICGHARSHYSSEMQDLGFQFTSTDEATVHRAGKHPIVIVCTGAHSAFELAETLLPKNAGKLLVVGNPPYERRWSRYKAATMGEKSSESVKKTSNCPKICTNRDLLKAGRLQAERLVRQRFPLRIFKQHSRHRFQVWVAEHS